MSIKTSKEIEQDMRKLILASPVASAVSGSVYFPGYRPRDSKLEEAVAVAKRFWVQRLSVIGEKCVNKARSLPGHAEGHCVRQNLCT